MKSVLIAAFVLVVSSNVFANSEKNSDGATIQASVETSTKQAVYNLVYKSKTEGTVKVTIIDQVGKVVLVDRIASQTGFVRPYNFEGLPKGQYSIIVNDQNGSLSLPIVYGKTLSAKNANIAIESLSEEKRYKLVCIGNEDAPVQVNIYDSVNNLVYSESIEAEGSFSKVYNLSKVSASNFTFEVVSKEQVVRKENF